MNRGKYAAKSHDYEPTLKFKVDRTVGWVERKKQNRLFMPRISLLNGFICVNRYSETQHSKHCSCDSVFDQRDTLCASGIDYSCFNYFRINIFRVAVKLPDVNV